MKPSERKCSSSNNKRKTECIAVVGSSHLVGLGTHPRSFVSTFSTSHQSLLAFHSTRMNTSFSATLSHTH